MDPFRLWLLFAAGLGAGSAGALLGVGGGILLVPLLNLAFRVPLPAAVAASLVCVIATSSGAASVYVQDRLCDIKLGMVLELATVVGAVAGALAAPLFARDLVRLALAGLLLFTAWQLLRPRPSVPGEDPSSYAIRRWPLGLGVSLVAGGLSGLLGIGGGPLKVPTMHLGMGVPFRTAIATSNFMIGVTAAASALVYYSRGDLDLAVVAPTATGVVAGAVLGARLMPRAPVKLLKQAFAGLLLFGAAEVGMKAMHLGPFR
ncbi:MAG: sulfite exporter TauE/SafE family protein [Myxococcales bacterium]|nr:sulfite exporter TauE/SafE family protein [Myxococcales bacterium]